LKAPGMKCLKLQYDEPLSNFAFNFNLRHYVKVIQGPGTEHALMKALMQAVMVQGVCAEVKLTTYRKVGRCSLTVSKPVLKLESACGLSA